MADPLSIAGLAAGVIPLGLKVFGAVKEYLDAVKAQSEEIASARIQADNMEELLRVVSDRLPRLQTDYPALATIVQPHVKRSEAELRELSDLLLELCRTNTLTTRSGMLLKLGQHRKKLLYPFNCAHIAQLETRLASVNANLRMALQVAQL
ncbi:putative ankyrin repeat-containing protein [Rosellinia necatrix]|uniref:Putative ankyrin repeat-containing protein n=1 Tax=Rosellinia necatrix TaxID=77044 RepID=A0A1S8AAX3_ROSNE|nr:putative ankyrin repeat-containing protein [Rosellinia necatrix]